MKERETIKAIPHLTRLVLPLILLFSAVASVCAQSAPTPTPPGGTESAVNASPSAPSASTDADAVQKRIERARALAAAHQLTAAASELETIRASVKDNMMRNVASLMLMGIYLEDGNYVRSTALLEETFKERSSKNEASVRTFFALAGQGINGARAHLARYRTFGIDVSNPALPSEAIGDLDRLRSLLERMAAQAKELIQADAKDSDAFALLEDVSGIRASLARDKEDRLRWDTEYSAARARLATLPTQIASNAGIPSSPSAGEASANGNGQTPADANGSSPGNSPQQNTAAVSITDATKVTGAPALFEVGSLTDKATTKVVPNYPQSARNAGASGLVRIKVAVDENGAVASILWVEGPVLLRQAALDAVKQWKFAPMVVNNKPVRMAGYIDFGFSR